MYRWRQLNEQQRRELVAFRSFNGRPWHSPEHRESQNGRYLLTAACFAHRNIIGKSPERMSEFATELLADVETCAQEIYAWCVLPNHYHVLVLTRVLPSLLNAIGKLHGRTSFRWNGEEGTRGRRVWFNCAETGMKSDRHFMATLNYVHHNPVHHGYAARWQEWPFSSGDAFLEQCGREEVARLWKAYPIREYGKDWDPPEL